MRPATTPSARPHLSGEVLDLLLIGALPAAKANAAKGHLDVCETCRARWRELNEDKRRFEEHVFARTLPKVEAEVARSGGYPLARPGRPVRLYVTMAAVLAAAIALGVVGWGPWADLRPTLELSRGGPDRERPRPADGGPSSPKPR